MTNAIVMPWPRLGFAKLLLLVFASLVLTFQGPANAQRPLQIFVKPVFFTTSWCPRPDELAALAKHMTLTMNGCCIYQGDPKEPYGFNAEEIEQWRGKIIQNNYPGARCDSAVMTEAEELNPGSFWAAFRARQQAEQTSELPSFLKSLNANDFCALYGDALRGQAINRFQLVQAVPSFTSAEARRRKLRIEDRLVTDQRVRLGSSLCQLYAALGPPDRANRTVGAWGEDIQHVYKRGYVYTRNGVVTAFQD